MLTVNVFAGVTPAGGASPAPTAEKFNHCRGSQQSHLRIQIPALTPNISFSQFELSAGFRLLPYSCPQMGKKLQVSDHFTAPLSELKR